MSIKNLSGQYKKAKLNHLSAKQFIFRKTNALRNKVYKKLLLYYVGYDSSVAEAAHSAKVYKKLQQRYSEHLSAKPTSDNTWETKPFPRVIWWCWLQGEDQIPELNKICLDSLKCNLPNYEVKILTLRNLHEYIKLPKIIIDKYKAGWIAGANFSDIIRLSLLAKYGGIWIDSTVYCTDNKLLKEIEEEEMFVYQNILSSNENIIKMSNWLMASKKGNPFFIEATELLTDYYKKSNYTEDYFVCHLILTMLTKKYAEIWNEMDIYNNVNPHMMQYMLNKEFSQKEFERIVSKSSFHKLNRHIKLNQGNTFYNHLKNEDNLCEEK